MLFLDLIGLGRFKFPALGFENRVQNPFDCCKVGVQFFNHRTEILQPMTQKV